MNSHEDLIFLEGNAVRVKDGRFQTALETLQHPETGSLVDLVGTVHVGEAEYYQDINRSAATRKAGGMVLHSESIMLIPEEEAASDPELAELRALHLGLRDVGRKEASRLALAPQIDYLRHGEVHDVSFEQFVHTKGPAHLEYYYSRLAKEHGRTTDFNLDERRAHDHNLVEIAGCTRQQLLGSGPNLKAELIREDKQITAIQEVLYENPGSGLILHWGAVHIPAFRESLQELGYELEDRRWITSQPLILG